MGETKTKSAGRTIPSVVRRQQDASLYAESEYDDRRRMGGRYNGPIRFVYARNTWAIIDERTEYTNDSPRND